VTALHHLATASPYIAALVVLLVIVSIGVLIWACLPERDRNSDIERQIATLRRHADHAVQTRPRVRAHSTCVPSMPPRTVGSDSNSPPLKPCGGGLCQHRADCADTYCPGRLSASLAGTPKARHAHH
jgi:hypothetical protein